MYLNVTIHSPVGVFVGSTYRKASTVEELIQFRDSLQLNAEKVTYFVVFVDDVEVLIPGDVFRSSITEFRIQDQPVTNKHLPV